MNSLGDLAVHGFYAVLVLIGCVSGAVIGAGAVLLYVARGGRFTKYVIVALNNADGSEVTLPLEAARPSAREAAWN